VARDQGRKGTSLVRPDWNKDMNSGKNIGRLAGLLWLLNCVTTYFTLGYARSRLIVSGDAATTAANILAHESLFRAAIVSNLLTHILLFFFGLTLYCLFKEFHRTLATVLLTSIIISVALAVANTLNSIGALVVLSQAEYLKVFGAEQLNAMAMIFLRLSNFGQGLLELFWTPFYFAFGLLVIKSKYLPKILGILLIIMSLGFPINTFTKLLIPQFHPEMFTLIAQSFGGLAGIPTILWLLIKGAKVPSLQ
jgi:Domain of unknown function (DUF4386)